MRLLKVKEAAARARCSNFTIYRWISCGMLPAKKVVGAWYIREEDLEALLTRPPTGMTLEEYVRLIVEGATTLTEEQVARLREALGRRNA